MPLNLTADELEAEFKKFGPIKQGGVQVRSNWQMGTCYGFVEYLSSSSMESAIQASPILIGGRKAVVEMKRTTSRVEGGRGRFPSSRGAYRSDGFRGDSFQRDGFRNDGVRGRGGFSGGRGYGRSDYGGRGEYSSPRGDGEYSSRGGRGPGRGGDGYQRGRARSSRQSGPVHVAAA
ncbi:Nuclear transport factor 2-like protein [Drosera capensis]